MNTEKYPALPVTAVVEEVKTALIGNHCAMLQAPPGAGKTTVIPPALMDAPWLEGRKIILLAPRRLAARAAATRMATMRGEAVGLTVGYRVRMDSRVSAATRIEVVTEGILTRMLQGDPSLEGIGLVIFDEFHERSLDADLGLALCLDMQGVLNPDLRLLIMSATLDTRPLKSMLGDVPLIHCSGRVFPVETRYVGRHTPDESLKALTGAVLAAARNEPGNILVFLPGASEIRAMTRRLESAGPGPEWIIAPLFANLTQDEQHRAISPPPAGRRKIVLATAIAETSLTIEGIRVVVDSGLQRLPRFDARSGLTRLVTVPVSKASADQRRGRAGRTGPGVCVRLWSQRMHHALPPAHRPEILEADLAGLALELAVWGIDDPRRLRWLDLPPPGAYEQSRMLLQSLNALDDQNRIRPRGRQMAALPLHPRLAHMMIAANERGQGAAACDLAALISERDPLRFDTGHRDTDMRLRFDLVTAARDGQPLHSPRAGVDHRILRRVIHTSDHLRRRLGCSPENRGRIFVGQLLAWAYPDRLAQRRPEGRGKYLLSSGRGARLDPFDPLASEDFLVAAELDGDRREARIFRAAAIPPETLAGQFESRLVRTEHIAWDPDRRMVTARQKTTLGALILKSEPHPAPAADRILAVLIEGIRNRGLDCLPWSRTLRSWQQRVGFLRRLLKDEAWPDVSDSALASQLSVWLGPRLAGMTRLRELARVDLKAALYGLLSFRQHRRLDDMAPTHLVVPSGSRIPIDYGRDEPVLSVRLQEMFGLTKTPTVAAGRQPLLIHLLSPAGRPVQITRDLAGFWQNGYPAVKKELKGRYPKHDWPDNPLSARPTARAKPRHRP